MSKWLIAACGVAYLVTALDLANKGQLAMAGVFVSYAAANAFLMLAVQ